MGMVDPPSWKDTIAAVATGGVLSAIGIVRLSGPETRGILDRVFRPADGRPMSAHGDRQLVYGRLLDPAGELLDLCLCTLSRGPGSYTGEDTGELQCHGSPVVLGLALESLVAAGARQAGPGEFTRRAFLNGRLDLTRAEAVGDLLYARTPLAARNAAGQLAGAVFRRVEAAYAVLGDVCAHFHAVLDYPDEEIEPFRLREYRDAVTGAAGELRALLDTFRRGRYLDAGVKTAIVGKPNVGKSSLLNALLGYERAIVTSRPGTTRDTVSEGCVLGRVPLRLTDTAGLRATEDEVERQGVERAEAALAEAELVLAVFDRSRPLEEGDRRALRLAGAGKTVIGVINKSDLPAAWAPKELGAGFAGLCLVSAREGTGLEELERAVEAAFPLPGRAAGEILTNARQAEAVGRALESMESALEAMDAGVMADAVVTELEGAMGALAELTGRKVGEDVTERIFSRFCVGK